MSQRGAATRAVARWSLAAFFVAAGINHFVFPATYAAIVPDWIRWAGVAVFWSGVFEIAGGVGVLVPAFRRAAAWGSIALLLAVFPANVDAALNGMELFGQSVPEWVLWVRLPVQGLFIAWVWWSCLQNVPRQ